MSLDSLTYHRTHPAWNKKDDSLKKKTFSIIKKYPEINCCHLTDILHEETETRVHNTTVRNWLMEENLYQPKQKIRHPRKRFEMASFDQLVQLDTSEHFWLPLLGKETCMIALEDDHSREILAAELVERDTTWNNMCLIRGVIEEYRIWYIPNPLYRQRFHV
jgi:regulator of replication initiation timing